MKVVRSLIAASARHKQKNVNGFLQSCYEDIRRMFWAVTAESVPLDMQVIGQTRHPVHAVANT